MRTEEGLVSIIVPVYNLGRYLETCITSLLAQTYRHLEIIMVNDGSSDNSLAVITQFAEKDSRVKVINQANAGAAAARNNGLSAATGEFIMFVDGDDYLSSDTVEKNLAYFSDPSLDWVEYPVKRVSESGEDIVSVAIGENFVPSESQTVNRSEFISRFFEKTLSGLVCGAIYRSASIKGIKFPTGMYYEDSFYFLDVLVRTSTGVLSPSGCYYYVARENSSQHTALNEKRLYSKMRYSVKLIDIVKKYFPDNYGLVTRQFPEYYYFYRLQVAKQVPGADKIFAEIVKIIGNHSISITQRCKILIYELFGYGRIMSLRNKIKGHLG